MTSALSVERISKTYGDIATLREISFDVAYGEVVVLLGPNGAGKFEERVSFSPILSLYS